MPYPIRLSKVTPIGAHTTNGTLSSAVTIAHGAAGGILIAATTQNVRYTLDGTTPTATTGFLIVAGVPVILPLSAETTLKVIEVTTTAVIQYQLLSNTI